MQKAYGKTQAEFETLVEGFAWALAGRDMAQVTRAFRAYVLGHSDIPAPADILKLMDGFRVADGVERPSVERLREYRAKGIPLTPAQQAELAAAGA